MSATALAPIEPPIAAAPRLKTRVVTDFSTFLALEPIWHELVSRAQITHPFLEHCWIRTWWECFGAGSRLHVIVVEEADRLIAIAPLIIAKTKIYGVPARMLGFFYNSHVPRCGFIVADRGDEAYKAIWREIRRSREWDVLQLCQLTETSETLAQMEEFAHLDHLSTAIWRSGASPRVPIDRTWDEYHQTLPNKHRSNLRNRYKRLDQLGPVELDTVTGGERRAGCLEEALKLEAAAWKGEAGTAITTDPKTQRFYEVFSERAAERGWLRLNFLRANGRAAAFDFSLEYQNRIFLMKLGYDPEFSPYSPSNLLLGTALKQAFERGLDEYDFLGEEAEWKRCWTTDTQSNFWLYVFAPSLRGRLLHWLKFRLAPMLKHSALAQKILGFFRSA